MKNNLLVIFGLLTLGVASRFLPHPPNFTAIMAIGLFAGYQFRSKLWSVGIPLTAMLLSDLFLGFHNTIWTVYISIAIIAVWGTFGLKKASIPAIGLSSIAGSLIFYGITNAGAWWFNPMYTKDFNGLMNSYALGLPFLRNGMLGDLFYNAVFFGVYYGVTQLYREEKTLNA